MPMPDHASAFDTPDDNSSNIPATAHCDPARRDPSNTFKDLRSASKHHHRRRRELEQYWHYRLVKPGQVGLEHVENLPLRVFGRRCRQTTLPINDDDEPVIMTRTELWREAQRWRPLLFHRRPKWYDTWARKSTISAPRRTERHARRLLEEDIEEAWDPWFMAYVTGQPRHAYERDDHVFRRCDVCWPELGSDWVRDEMFNADGEGVGQFGQEWEVGVGVGFAGRAKVGALFLMGEEDWTSRIENPWLADADACWDDGWGSDGWGWEESGEVVDGGEDDELADETQLDSVSTASSWDDLGGSREVQVKSDDDWDVLSSSSSWSCLSI